MNRKTLSACNRTGRSVTPNGFTLMELLIVIAVILILMLMAMKTIGSMRIRANEVSAINSLRVITQAEIEYDSTYPANGFACDLKDLGGVPGSGLPTPSGRNCWTTTWRRRASKRATTSRFPTVRR